MDGPVSVPRFTAVSQNASDEHQSDVGKVGERSSWGVSCRRSEDMVLSGSVDYDPPNDWAAFCELQGRVQRDGVGQLKGTQVGKAFCDKLNEIVDAGKFNKDKADYLRDGVTMGFDLGLDESVMKGKRVFKNCPTAYAAKEKVSDALRDRVLTGKTLKLGAFDGDASKLPGKNATVVPMGAVAKKLQ